MADLKDGGVEREEVLIAACSKCQKSERQRQRGRKAETETGDRERERERFPGDPHLEDGGVEREEVLIVSVQHVQRERERERKKKRGRELS
jgi:hypothetical protein